MRVIFISFMSVFLLSGTIRTKESYRCLPCGNNCDNIQFKEPGKCPDCQMTLMKASSITFTTIQPSGICAYIHDHPDVVLLDVRTKEEFEEKANPNYGRLKNAINIPIQELASRLSEIEKYKNREVIVYCSHSHRSPQASYLLTQKGFTHVMNMAGGMSVLEDKTCRY